MSIDSYSADAKTHPSPIRGSGLMSARIRGHAWENTPLGPIKEWPVELLTSVNSMLTSKQIVCLIWGESEQVLLYNDLYMPLVDSRKKALGEPFLKVWSEIREQAAAIIAEPYRTQEANIFERVAFFVLVGGELVERICTLTNNPVWSVSGGEPKILGLYQTVVDHTDGEIAARKLREERERLREVMAASRDAVTLVDREWRITYLNPTARAVIGLENDFISRNLWEAFPDIAREDSPCRYHFPRAMHEGISASFETHYPEPYNVPIWVDVFPTSDGIVTFVRDISDKKKAETALIKNEKLAAVGRLAASIAHEINNPLESVTNLLYLANTTSDAEKIKRYLSSAERELRRVSVISNQTLRFYKQATKPRSVTDHELLETVLSIYQGRLLNSGIHVEQRLRAQKPIQCYDGEIRQVLNNLMANAIDVMNGGGRLLIRTRDAKDWITGKPGIQITIADTGPGMTDEVKQRLFEAFYTTKGIGGNGLGLWISKEIIDRHRGRIMVRTSQRIGATGTVFMMFLPAAAADR
jgi:PAS domain S-box-containing protein